MVAPIDYTLQGVQSPFQALQQGMQFGAGLAQAQAQRQQFEAQAALAQQKAEAERIALERQRLRQETVSRLVEKVRNGTWTEADFVEAQAGASKDESESLNKIWTNMSASARQGMLAFGSNVFTAAGENPEAAKQFIRERAAAERNSGNPQQAKAYEDWARTIDLVPAENVQAAVGSLLAGLDGGKDTLTALKSWSEEQRAKKLASFALRKETAEAIIKEAEAKLAPERFLAGLNLTQAQIKQAEAAQAASRAAERASGAAAQRAAAEAQSLAAGIVPVEKRPEYETKFRKEYSDQTAGYREVKSAYGRVLASQDNAVGDLSLIFGYMKMLDPGSVVREGEFATAQNAAGVPDRVLNIYNRVLSGDRLNAGQRKAFKGQAEGLFKQAGQQEAAVRSGLERIAKGYGLNTANIFLEAAESAPTAPKMGGPEIPTAAPAPTPTPMAPAEGTRSTSKSGRSITFRGGRWVYD